MRPLAKLRWTLVLGLQYNIIQYKTCNAPYVTRMLFVGAGDDTWLGSIGNVEKMSYKFTFKNINRVASSNVIRQIILIYSRRVFETYRLNVIASRARVCVCVSRNVFERAPSRIVPRREATSFPRTLRAGRLRATALARPAASANRGTSRRWRHFRVTWRPRSAAGKTDTWLGRPFGAVDHHR